MIPVVVGGAVRWSWTPGAWLLEGALPIFSMAVIAWIVGVIVALNRDELAWAGVLFLAVILHNTAGLVLCYLGSRLAKLPEKRRRSVSIEVGMQNSGLAVALALGHFEPAVAVPGAIFSVWHNVTGPLLAAIWRRRQPEGKPAARAVA